MALLKTVQYIFVAFTPKGGCPLKQRFEPFIARVMVAEPVAFTPKGGCPLKRGYESGNWARITSR